MRLYAATGDGIARLDEVGEAWTVDCPCRGAVRNASRSTRPTRTSSTPVLREGGVRRSIDGGGSWIDCELPQPGVFSLAVSAANGAVYAGTEPSSLFRSDDRGESWRELEANVHSLAWHPHTPGRAYEAGGGGAAFSTDAGETWQRADEGRDRHDYTWSVTVDPDDPDRPATGRGLARRHRCSRSRHELVIGIACGSFGVRN